MARRKSPQNGPKKLLINNPTIGADIEVFLQDTTSREIVSAEGIIKGSKHAPYVFHGVGNDFFATSLDNIMVEFNIPPAREPKMFSDNILYALGWIKGSIPDGLDLIVSPSARVDPRFLQTENAKLFGCEPDYNAWLMGKMNDRPSCDSNLRSAGGHIHVGYDNPNHMLSMALIRSMDIHLGLPSIIQEPDNERKSLYGKAGAFRFKDYGTEYRTISNYYISAPSLMEWAYNNTLAAIEFVNNQMPINEEEAVAIQAAINTNDKALATTMCTYFGVKLAA